MVKIELKGIHRVCSKGRVYWYAWRGGPRLRGEPGTPEFSIAYNEAISNHKSPETGKFKSFVVLYRESVDYRKLADSTRRNWSPWFDRISDYFGELSIAQFNRPERIRPVIRRWRANYAEKARTADYGMQVLSRVLSYAVDPLGRLASNPCEGIKQIYSSDRSELIWTDADIDRLKRACSAEVGHATDLASHTGLRAGDLVKLAWSNVSEDAIVIRTGKSGMKREAIIPLYVELRDVLARIPRRSPIILTNSKGRPWGKDSLGNAFVRAKNAAWAVEDKASPGAGLHFHDLRGTAATRFYVAGLSEREIAEVMAWEEGQVSRIIRRYVTRGAAVKDRIRRLDAAGS